MTKDEYSELLKDVRWKKKRNKIVHRDNDKCTNCGSTRLLHVHHMKYELGKLPWEYDDNDLVTLCKRCHKNWHDKNDNKSNKTQKESFYLIYSSMVLILKASKDVNMKLFASLLERYSHGVEFSMNGELKKIIAKECECSPRSLDNSFSFLVKENIIVKIGANLYKINPRHIFKGSNDQRNRELKSILELYCKDC